MEKTIVNPDTGDWAGHEVAYSDAVVVETPTHDRLFVSGMISDSDGLAAQTRDVLERIQAIVRDQGGSMDDVVRVRVYLRDPIMNEGALETVHGVRAEFFDRDHYPASTLVEVAALVDEDALIEIDADAMIPTGGWESRVG